MTGSVREKSAVARRGLLVGALALLSCAGAASAYTPAGQVGMTIVDRETGREIPVYSHRGRQYIAGQPGGRYSLRVTNNTGGRVLVVLSVDGVNILTGETAGYNQRGYVFRPYETYDISGWRKSDSEVAAFSFARLSNSYAARTGRPGDVGVIGMAVFNEKVRYEAPYYPEISRAPQPESRSAPSAQARAMPAPPPPPAAADSSVEEVVPTGRLAQRQRNERLGTAHGEREWSRVTTVAFERASRSPQYTRQIEYDTYANLRARGVIPTRPTPQPRPRPFPNGAGYVPDPPRY